MKVSGSCMLRPYFGNTDVVELFQPGDVLPSTSSGDVISSLTLAPLVYSWGNYLADISDLYLRGP